MANPLTIKTSTRRVNGINTRIEVNVETGAATLYQDNGLAGRTVLATASSIGNNWTITNNFTSLYGTRVGSSLTQSQAQTYFAKDFQGDANNDRASIINTWSPPNTKTYLTTTAKVPGVIDPVTGLKTGQTTSPTKDPAPILDPPPAAAPDPAAGGGSVPIDPQYFKSNPIQSSSEDVEYGTLYYPLNRRNTEDYDYLKVTVIKFLETGLRTDAKSFNVISTEKRGVKPLGRVFLPMQPGISDTNGVSWNEDRLNPFQAALGGVAASAIATLGDGKFVAGAQGLFQGLINTGQNIANDPNMQNYVSAYFAGQAVGANLVARTTGAVLNNNLELLFNGPKLRSFRYNFRFTPRDEPESAMIKKIIRMFKREMAASRSDTGLFLITPNVFELEYMTSNNEPHPFLNKIKRCALSDISVNYTPDGTYMTYQDRSMTSYEVQLQFSELEPIYKEDYDSGVGTEGMGY